MFIVFTCPAFTYHAFNILILCIFNNEFLRKFKIALGKSDKYKTAVNVLHYDENPKIIVNRTAY